MKEEVGSPGLETKRARLKNPPKQPIGVEVPKHQARTYKDREAEATCQKQLRNSIKVLRNPG